MKKVIILANAFPYGTWEPYLADELPHLAQRFPVTIFSLMVRTSQLTTQRSIPRNITVHPILFAARWVYLLWAFRVLGDAHFYREMRLLLSQGRLTGARVIALCVFLARTHYEKHRILRILKRSKDFSPSDDVVIYAYRFLYQPYLASLISRYFSSGQARIVARAHGADLYEERHPTAYLPLRQLTCKCAHAIAPISTHGREYLVRHYENVADKCHVFHLGVSDRPQRPDRPAHTPLAIATCSSITDVKRLPLLCDALALMPSSTAVHWHHYGTGPGGAALQARAASLPPHITVTWHGHLTAEELTAQYSSGEIDYLVNVSSSEGIPVSMMEAYACAIPVIATDVGGVSEIVIPHVNGILLPADSDASAVAGILAECAALSDEIYAHLRAGARHSWAQHWNADAVHHDFAAFVERL